MKNTPIERQLVNKTIEDFHIADFAKATIREVKAIAAKVETISGMEFIKMEMGVPGLPPSEIGVKAEIEALEHGIASLYPDINGLPSLKKEASCSSKPLSMWRWLSKDACLSPVPCKVLLPRFLLAVSVTKKRYDSLY